MIAAKAAKKGKKGGIVTTKAVKGTKIGTC
jgi:hypothetical protein